MSRRTSRVAIAGCRLHGDAAPDELFPDVDAPLLAGALADLGLTASCVAWDDPRPRWSDFDAVVVRSTWDAVDRPEEYLAWAKLVDGETILINPLAAIVGTLDKHFLADLAVAGLRLPRTTFLTGSEGWQTPHGDFVVKPAISGGGRETALYRETKSMKHAGTSTDSSTRAVA